MQNEVKKHLLDKFQVHLLSEFGSYCKRHDLEASTVGLVTFLVDRELIPRNELQQYTIQREVAAVMGRDDCPNKTQAVGIVAHRFNITERTVWSMLKK